MAELEKDYEILKKKYSLPNFEELDNEFELSCIEEPKFLLKEIRFRIDEKLDSMCAMIEEILQPDTKVSTLYESRMFNEAHKEQAFAVFKKLMKLKKKSTKLSILNSEKDDAAFITSSLDEWRNLKKPLVALVDMLIDAWEKEPDAKENVSYMG